MKRIALVLLLSAFSSYADHWIPPPSAMKIGELPPGSLLRLRGSDQFIPGAHQDLELTKGKVYCYLQFAPVNWERKVSAKALFYLESATEIIGVNKYVGEGVITRSNPGAINPYATEVRLGVHSDDANFVTEVSCRHVVDDEYWVTGGLGPNVGPVGAGDTFYFVPTMSELAALFDIFIVAPDNASNPELVSPYENEEPGTTVAIQVGDLVRARSPYLVDRDCTVVKVEGVAGNQLITVSYKTPFGYSEVVFHSTQVSLIQRKQ